MNNSFKSYLGKNIKFNFTEFYNSISFDNVVADLFISNKCNLKCRHCYFGNTSNISKPLSKNEWINAIDKLYSVGVRHFHFSGKESSLCKTTIELIDYIKSNSQTYAGIVSNGLGNLDYYNQILNTSIDYLEFSIDGLKENHNFIRGGDFFDRTYTCINSLKGHASKFNLATCLYRHNYNDYIDLISTFYQLGVSRFFATPFVIKGRAKKLSDLSITIDEYAILIQSLFNFLQRMPNAKLQIRCCFPINYTNQAFEQNSFFKQIIIDFIENNKKPIFKINGNVIELSFTYINIDYINTITISNDGYIIPCADDISNPKYFLYSIGNISDINTKTLVNNRENIIKEQTSLFYQNYGT